MWAAIFKKAGDEVPHGIWGLGWGEIVSLGTLIVVVLNYIKTSISNTAHESSKKDLQDLNNKLFDFKLNVSELSSLLKQVNRDIGKLVKRVDRSEQEIENIKIDVAKIKEKVGVKDDDHNN